MKPYYEHAGVTIYHGDCREILPVLAPVDLIVTDPPYGIGEARGKNRSRGNLAPATDYGLASWDDKPPAEWLFGLMRERSRWQIIFGGNFFPLPPSSCWLVWDKDNTGDFADCELAWTNLPRAVRRLRYRWNGMLQEPGRPREFREHPTQKPVDVMKWALSHASEARTVRDPFAGSGSTLVAAKSLGLVASGIELEERYCEIAAKRLGQEVLPLRPVEYALEQA